MPEDLLAARMQCNAMQGSHAAAENAAYTFWGLHLMLEQTAVHIAGGLI